MVRLKVKMAELESTHNAEVDADTGLLHGIKVLTLLVMPWVRIGHIICADSYFALVPAAAELKRLELHFIGAMKTASQIFPHDYLARLELSNQGERKGFYCKTGGSDD
jgi:hypothetical protein